MQPQSLGWMGTIPMQQTEIRQDDKSSYYLTEDWLEEIKPLVDREILDYITSRIHKTIDRFSIVQEISDFQPYLEKISAKRPKWKSTRQIVRDLNQFDLIFSKQSLNKARYVNKYLESMNESLNNGGYLVMWAETASQRRDRLFRNYSGRIRNLFLFIDLLVQSAWPKIPYLNKIYFWLTQGQERVLSAMEICGRLYSCGYSIVNDFNHNGRKYYIAQKESCPAYNQEATYGPIIKLHRVGKNGKMIKVYKLRTMYPFSEYLQKYFHEKNGLAVGGKFANDQRITPYGRKMRKYFIDELPMLINLLHGDLKLFGVRPLSQHYLSLYPEEYRKYRGRFKPGVIPPYYVDMPTTLDEIIESEKKYLSLYEKEPFLIDVKYTILALYHILFKNKRSS